jgi:hypothetical protein
MIVTPRPNKDRDRVLGSEPFESIDLPPKFEA